MYENDTNIKGLKALRSSRARKPEHVCENCSCKRYSPCNCKVKVKRTQLLP